MTSTFPQYKQCALATSAMEGEFKFSPRYQKMSDNAVAYETLSDNVTETTRKVALGGNHQVAEECVAATPQVCVFER